MRAFAVLSALVAITSAFKFHGAVPHNKKGKAVSHQAPHLNIPLTGAKINPHFHTSFVDISIGKRRLDERDEPAVYVPSVEEIDSIRNDFAHVIPKDAKRDDVALNGVVAVFSDEQGFMGYIALNQTQYATQTMTQDTSQVAFTYVPNATPPPHFDLGIYNASAPYLAVIEGYSGSNWGKGKPGYGSMTVVQHSTYPASNTDNPTYLPSESNIWSVDYTSGLLTATWFNDNGKQVPCTIYWDVTYSDFGFTGDLKQYVKLYLDTTIIVSLYFVGLW